MIRLEKFQISKTPYAVQPESLKLAGRPRQKWVAETRTWENVEDETLWSGSIQAFWFKRKSGLLSAHIGSLGGHFGEDKPSDFLDFMAKCDDGRYGANCVARWDGDYLWAPETKWPDQVRIQAFLEKALLRFPEMPAAYNGWWTYRKADS